MNLQEFIKKYGNKDVNEQALKHFLGINDKKYFYPNKHMFYFKIGEFGEVIEHANANSSITAKHFENNELLSTYEEAEEYARKQRFLLQMKRDFLDNTDEIDWDNNTQFKYHLIYVHHFEVVESSVCYSQQYSGFYTTNKSWLDQYISENEEEIKKYYFEVK